MDPDAGIDLRCDILIKNGTIEKISPRIDAPPNVERIDAEGLTITPGFIDIHVHLREPGQEYKETIATGSRAAVRGGFTSIACMPNTSPVNDNVSTTRYILSKAAEAGLVNVFPAAAVTMGLAGKELVDMEALHRAGVRGFSDDGRCVMNGELMGEALKRAKALNLPVMQHSEDHSLSGNGHLNEGKVSRTYGLKGIPAEAENAIIARDIELQRETGGMLHVTHLSTAGAMTLVKNAKERGLTVTADVTPHHLLLTEDVMMERLDAVYKMKPPLRTEGDRQAMIEGIKTGTIDCIATDHAPHSREEKAGAFEDAPFGVTGMETSFPVVYDRLVRTGIIDMERLIRLFSSNPAKVLGLTDRGTVREGFPADLTLLDLDREFIIRAEDFHSRSINCPFIGWKGKGVVAYTIVGGKIVYNMFPGGLF